MGNYISIRAGATALPEESVGHLPHELVYQSGVYDPSSHWLVSEHSPQNMSVDIAEGRGFFKKTSMTYNGYSDAVNNVVIGANASGNPRIDSIVAYVDLGAAPNADASNVLTFEAVQGTPAASPVAPDSAAIEAAIGAGNPYIVLANVTVDNGASSIVNAKISDERVAAYQKWLAGHYQPDMVKPNLKASKQAVNSISGSGAKTLDCSENNVHEVTMTGDVTLSLSNISVGQFIQIDIIQDGTGSHTPTWFSTIKWADGVAPVITPTALKRDSFVFKCVSAGNYIGYVAAQNL